MTYSMLNKSCYLCRAPAIEYSIVGPIKIEKCKKCQFQYIVNFKDILGGDYFDKHYSERRRGSKKINRLRKLQYEIDVKNVSKYIKDGSIVLDVGCSNGDFIGSLNEIDKNFDILGIDIDGSAIKEANLKYGDIATFQKKDLLAVDLEKKYDIVIFRGTFQYFGSNFHETMKHLKKIIHNSSTIIILSLPSTDSFIFYLLREKWALFHPEMPLMFNESSIRYVSDLYDFSIEELQYPYLGDVYSNIESDYKNIKEIIKGGTIKSVPFWGSIMNIVLTLRHDRI
jgi:SAM-dependent methyltransferase